MEALLELILAPLEPGMAAQVRLCYGATRHDPDANELYALNEALRDSPDEYPPDWWPDPARCRWWLGLHVDWKAYDEVAWQIRAISHSLGLEPGFESSEAARWHGYFEQGNRKVGTHPSIS